eukprot:gene16864-23133_t
MTASGPSSMDNPLGITPPLVQGLVASFYETEAEQESLEVGKPAQAEVVETEARRVEAESHCLQDSSLVLEVKHFPPIEESGMGVNVRQNIMVTNCGAVLTSGD